MTIKKHAKNGQIQLIKKKISKCNECGFLRIINRFKMRLMNSNKYTK